MANREGPSIRLEASCSGCRYECNASYAVQGDSGFDVSCSHPNNPGRHIGDSTWRTPSWCPLLAAVLHPDAPIHPDEHCIVCPYCLYEDDEPGEYSSLEHDGDTMFFECPECGQTSKVTVSITREYLSEPVDPEIPRTAFYVNISYEGEPSFPMLLAPASSTSINIFVAALLKTGRDPFLAGVLQQLVLEGHDGTPLSTASLLVNQGVRPNHQLTIRRKVTEP